MQAVGAQWHYILTWHYTGKDIDTTDEESFDVEVVNQYGLSMTLKVSQKLTATLFDDQRIPTDSKAAPSINRWALSPTGSVAFMPNARFALESRVYRILKGVMPEPKGDPLRLKEWTIEYADDGLGMPQSRLMVRSTGPNKEGAGFAIIYREKSGTNGSGQCTRTEKVPFPTTLTMKFSNTKMPGGTDIVDCDFSMKLKVEK